jgi:hypothetical protein
VRERKKANRGGKKYIQIEKQKSKQEMSLAAAGVPYFATEVCLLCHMAAYKVLHLYRNVGGQEVYKNCVYLTSRHYLIPTVVTNFTGC